MPKATSAAEMMAALPNYFVPEQAAGINAVLQLDLSGEGGGQWYLTLADGKLKVDTGAAAEPTMTLALAAGDFLALINGEASPMNLFMQGKVKVRGDMQLALKMQSLFKRPE